MTAAFVPRGNGQFGQAPGRAHRDDGAGAFAINGTGRPTRDYGVAWHS